MPIDGYPCAMATTTGLEVRVHEGRERAEVKRVTETLNDVVRSLHDIDQMHLLSGTRPTWVMADMGRHDDDLVMRLEARQVSNGRPLDDVIIPALKLVAGAQQLHALAEVPELFTPDTVQRVGKLATARDGVQSVSLATYNGTLGPEVVLDDAVKTNATAAIQGYDISYGTITGHLTTLAEARRGKSLRVGIRNVHQPGRGGRHAQR